MIVVENVVLTDEVMDEYFVCDLLKCQGACCEEGDLGAPLTEEETKLLPRLYAQLKPFLTPEGIAAIEQQGFFVKDEEGDFSTPTVGKRACAYAVRDEKGWLKCGIELAYQKKAIDFQKPISCHLYPLRIAQYEQYYTVNYHRWHICNSGCQLGKSLQVPLYEFLKEALIRKYGETWYRQLVAEIHQRQKERTLE